MQARSTYSMSFWQTSDEKQRMSISVLSFNVSSNLDPTLISAIWLQNNLR